MNKKSERLLDVLGQIDPELIEDAAFKANKNPKRKSPIKWLSIAACFIMVTVVGVVAWRSGVTDPSDPVLPDNNTTAQTDRITDPTPENDVQTDTDTDTDTTVVKDTETDSDTTVENPESTENSGQVNGGTRICTAHPISYHSYLNEFIKYVGEENYNEWTKKYESESQEFNDNGCLWKHNIHTFIKEFNFPQDVFVEILNSNPFIYYTDDYNVDLLYNGSEEEIDTYYRNHVDRKEEYAKKSNFIALKIVTGQKYSDKIKQHFGNNATVNSYSFPELIYLLDIPQKELETMIKESVSKYVQESYLNSLYDYDLDLIYNQREFVEELIKEHSVFYMDQLFCGEEPREMPYPVE